MKQSSGDGEQLLMAYRHDEHKTRGGSHAAGVRTIDGVKVNQDVSYGADRAAGALSRPSGKPKQTMPTGDETHYRRSLFTGETAYDPHEVSRQRLEGRLDDLFTMTDAEAMHEAWLSSDLTALFNESVYYPYTSLKYHTLLVGALLDNFQQDHEFGDLYLRLEDGVTPYRTVFDTGDWCLTIAPDDSTPSAKISSYPWPNWFSVWSRLSEHPFDASERRYMVLDAQLRRIESWSTALQYLEDFLAREGEL